MTAYERLCLVENMNFSWQKVRRMHQTADGFVDYGEFYEFELNLEKNLSKIRQEFISGKYKLQKIRPLPRPKKYRDDKTVDRQYYHISIRDQVAWMAFANAIGPLIDEKMEAWSYGNRLYRAAWYEPQADSRSKLEFGPYRHSSGHLYKKFQNSWPLFRRHVSLTARTMALRRKLQEEEMDEAERLAQLAAEQSKLIYFAKSFFEQPSMPSKTSAELYHASIDLKQFYPCINKETIKRNLKSEGATSDPRMERLLSVLLDFKLDMSEMAEFNLKSVEPKFTKSKVKGIPTGLYVSGFLSNCAMLEVDRKVQSKLGESRQVAHFRFVDDHTILSYDFDTLCEWIEWYKNLLAVEEIGAVVNEEKIDPPSLSVWLKRRSARPNAISNSSASRSKVKIRDAAIRETKIDGRNPTKLMTKTLAQVSAIAATDLDVLDDRDLQDRFKMLEWLLLSDIPEREIRPDTRAAFAAGQIAALAPILIQEADGIVAATRRRRQLKQEAEFLVKAGAVAEINESEIERLDAEIMTLVKALKSSEHQHLKRCFDLLMQSFRDHPGKARLFFKIHKYLQVTGYAGINDLGNWISETRDNGHRSWAEYYGGLSLQILARLSLLSSARVKADGYLRSESSAALAHLENLSKINLADFRPKDAAESWFHRKARIELGVALRQCAAELCDSLPGSTLPKRLRELGLELLPLSTSSSGDWITATEKTSGVWAHAAEELLQCGVAPTTAWRSFAKEFDLSAPNDLLALRRYPDSVGQGELSSMLKAGVGVDASDAGWLRDVVDGGEQSMPLMLHELSSRYDSARGARDALMAEPEKYFSVETWTKLASNLDYFDPRRSEWTALEIASQLIEQHLQLGKDDADLLYVHPKNIFLPDSWILSSDGHIESKVINWATWRGKIRARPRAVIIASGTEGLSDYRFTENKDGSGGSISEHQYSAVGRLILGMVRFDHSSPTIWNIRGNENIYPLTKRDWFERIPISSLTFRLIESCLGGRAAETRLMKRIPELFGRAEGESPNDTEFDPPELNGLDDLLREIEHARSVLEENQISVTLDQPRQLIPFKLADFSTKIAELNNSEED